MSSAAKGKLVSFTAFAILLAWSFLLMPFGWLIWLGHKLTRHVAFRRLGRTAGWIYGRSSLMMLRPFIKIRSVNAGEGVGRTPCIITANHQSILDLYLLGYQDVVQVCPVTKSWPFKLLLPFTAVMRTAGYVEAEGRDPEDVLRDCRERLSENTALIVYPEGHRSRDGRLGKFHAGAFIMALEENIPIVPMVIKNSGDIIPAGTFTVHPGTLEIEMLPAIMPSEYDKFRAEPIPHRALLKHVKQMYKDSLDSFRG